MGNLVLTNPNLKSREEQGSSNANGLLLEADTSIWSSLFSNLADLFSCKQQPPLVLTSRPVPVDDPLRVRHSPASSALSFLMHSAIIALILWMALSPHKPAVAAQKPAVTSVDIRPFIPITAPAQQVMGGGGGGGAHEIVEPIKGHLPKIAKTQTVAPQILLVDKPKMAVEPTVVMPQEVKIADSSMPNVGMPQSPQIAMASQGSGGGSGFGSGHGGGIGSGSGGGIGPGSGGGYGGGIMSVGGGVSAPQVIHAVDPDFTDEARRAKVQGVVSIQVIVDTHGNPQNIQVVRALGMGLDQKAIEAVRQYKFRPAMYQGRPVPVRVVIDVNFHLY
ncbi:MAG: energy transducer TonB [Silvibacterium sp.]|nr:energy transducer TonB [Silvibacterium sp.]